MFVASVRLGYSMDIQVFKTAVFPIQAKLLRLAVLMLRNEEEAEDTVQEALLKLWLNRHNLKNYRSIEALAVVITKNLCKDKLRSSRWKNSELSDQADPETTQPGPHQLAEQRDSRNLMLRLMQNLPDQQKLVVHLRDVEEYSFEEIEKITGLGINNIRVTLSRARQNLRQSFKKVNAYGSA